MNFVKVFSFLICIFILFVQKGVAEKIKCRADTREISSIFTASIHKIGKRNSFTQIMERTNKILKDLKTKNMANKICNEAASYCFRHKLSRYSSVEARDITYFTTPDSETDFAAIIELKLYLRHTAFLQCHFQERNISQHFFISTYEETGYPWFVYIDDNKTNNPEIGSLKGVLTK